MLRKQASSQKTRWWSIPGGRGVGARARPWHTDARGQRPGIVADGEGVEAEDEEGEQEEDVLEETSPRKMRVTARSCEHPRWHDQDLAQPWRVP